MARLYEWKFPLPRTHTGMLLGNGTMGAMIWGEGRHLRVTVGRADFWDHRGGMAWTAKQTYAGIRDCLERKDEAGLRKLFETTGQEPGTPHRPSVIPVGRLDFDLGEDAKLLYGVVDMDGGEISVHVRRGRHDYHLNLVMDMGRPLLSVALPAGLEVRIDRQPAWEHVGEHLASVSFEPPAMVDEDDLVGWTQMRPVDPTLFVGYRRRGRQVAVVTGLGADAKAACQAARQELVDSAPTAIRRRARGWWSDYWRSVPTIDIPNQLLLFLHDYGMYKFAGLTNPNGIAATLQGPWIEEYQMPPWSSDYHFNINVQMCYWPAYHGNCLEHLRPLWELIESWMPQLRQNAKYFLGIDDGVMLPHAVDDHCTCMGGFWTGTVDHGCTAWVAQMMYRYYRYTMDASFLQRQAYPFMVAAMRVYEEMLERDGDSFVLPVSVSPEYRGASMNAWGANASFQLACLHRLCEDLLEAAEALGETPRPIWHEINEKCPRACLIEHSGGKRIGLWQGTDLEQSHRHHSHLASLAPFDTIDLDDPAWQPIVMDSIRHWIWRGPGEWSGWCIPWASMIHSRLGNGDAAELWLELWQKVFTNIGHGTLHDVDFAGFSIMGKGATCAGGTRKEIMQMDAGMSCTAAIHEMLLHVRRGVHYVFRGAPESWEEVSFSGIRTDGAFLVSSSRVDGCVESVTLESPAGGVFVLANPWDAPVTVTGDDEPVRLSGAVLKVSTEPGQTLVIAPAV